MTLRRILPFLKKKQNDQGLFFDQFSDGMGGFSFRKLKSDYTGRWGRFININTAEERDIGFDGNYIDVADLLDLTNGSDTVEITNYDNSQMDIFFTPDPTRRPIVAYSGTLVTIGGLLAADFPAIRRIVMSLSSSGTSDISPISLYVLAKIDAYAINRNLSLGSVSGNFGYFHGGNTSGYNGIGVHDSSINVLSLSDEDLERRLGVYHWNGTDLKIGSNDSALTTFTGTSGTFPIRNIGVGQISSAQAFRGKIQEILAFSANKESDDLAIRANINSFITP